MKKLTFLIIFILSLIQLSLEGQNTKLKSQLQPKVSIAPLYPNVCPDVPSKVHCTGEFDNYEWVGVDSEFQEFGRNIELTQPGRYQLIVKGITNDTSYRYTYDFIAELSDLDKDGVCDIYDCAASNPLVSSGVECDDDNPCTENDVFDAECNCVGSPKSDCDYIPTQIKESKFKRIQAQLSSAYSVNIRKDYEHSSSFERFFQQTSRIPNAMKLVEKEIKAEMRKLSSPELKDLFVDIMNSRYTPGYIGNNLESISANTIKAWRGLWKTPIQFRAKTASLDSVEMYMVDFDKTSADISKEIIDTPKGFKWWYNYELGRKYWVSFLEDMDNIKSFSQEIIEFNKQTEGRGNILSGSPSSAINTALYYDDVLEQGASIFKTIIKNHMFYDGNKRTAVSTIISYMNKAGIPLNKSEKKIFKLAKKVAKDKIVDVSDIAKKLIE